MGAQEGLDCFYGACDAMFPRRCNFYSLAEVNGGTAPGCNVGCPLQLTRIEPHLQINVLLKRGFRARHGPTMGCYAASGTIWLAMSENDEEIVWLVHLSSFGLS